MAQLESIKETEFRILPSEQDRSKKINSILRDNIHIYNLENDFDINLSKLQSGAYGEVIQATIKTNGETIILKKFKGYSRSRSEMPDDIIKEIAFLQLLNKYPQTKAVLLYGVALSTDLKNIYLVLESLEKSLNDIKQANFSNEQIKIILYKIIHAIHFIHGVGIIHNDIKLSNIMINNTDIRFIDFGISEYLGIGPAKDLVSDYICTEITKAPDSEDQLKFGYIPNNRKSYASDMFSIGCTIIQLVIKNNYKIIVSNNKIYSVDQQGVVIDNLTTLLQNDQMFGPSGFDLLLKIMNINTHERLCAIEALKHPYFIDMDEFVPIDRTIIMGGNIKNIYDRQQHYTNNEFTQNQMELCYLEIQHQTFIDQVIPLEKIHSNLHLKYFILLDWIFDVYINTNLIQGIDSFINNICFINNYFNSIYLKYGNSKIQMAGILPNHISRSIYNYTQKDIEYYCEISSYAFDRNDAFEFILNDLLIANEFKIPIYPISNHLQFVFLQLKYVLKDQRIQSEELLKKIYIDICLNIIFILIQPEPINQILPFTIWEIIIFATNRTLSLILDIPIFEINIHPFLNFLTLDDYKFNQMNIYFQTRINNPIVLQNAGKLELLMKVFYNNQIFIKVI